MDDNNNVRKLLTNGKKEMYNQPRL